MYVLSIFLLFAIPADPDLVIWRSGISLYGTREQVTENTSEAYRFHSWVAARCDETPTMYWQELRRCAWDFWDAWDDLRLGGLEPKPAEQVRLLERARRKFSEGGWDVRVWGRPPCTPVWMAVALN